MGEGGEAASFDAFFDNRDGDVGPGGGRAVTTTLEVEVPELTATLRLRPDAGQGEDPDPAERQHLLLSLGELRATVNVYLVLKFFVFVGDKAGDLPKYLEFRRLLAWMFIDNPYMPVSEQPSDDPFLAGARCHDIGSAPPYASAYVNRKWFCDNKSKYVQYTCKWP